MGRPRLSDQEKVARGTYRLDRDGLPSQPVKLPDAAPPKPDDLSEAASAFWDAVVPSLFDAGVVRFVDSAELALMCRYHAESQRLWKALDQSLVEDKGHYRLVNMASTTDKAFRELAAKFGLNPMDRGKLRLHNPNGEEATEIPTLADKFGTAESNKALDKKRKR